jgi:hypothetical protein
MKEYKVLRPLASTYKNIKSIGSREASPGTGLLPPCLPPSLPLNLAAAAPCSHACLSLERNGAAHADDARDGGGGVPGLRDAELDCPSLHSKITEFTVYKFKFFLKKSEKYVKN